MPKCRFFPPGIVGLEISCAFIFQSGFVRWAEIRRAAEEPGDVLRQHVQHLARGFPAGDALRIGRENREIAVPVRRELAPLHLVNLGSRDLDTWRGRQRRVPSIGRRAFAPRCADAGREVLADAIRHEELRVFGPSVAAFGEADLIVAERLAMGFGGVLLVWRTVADVAVQDDKGRTALRLPEDLQSVLDSIDVVGIADPQDIPAISQKPGRDILREGDARVSLDGDVVVVVDPAEVIQAEMAGE